MENPKQLFGKQQWPPSVSVDEVNIVEGHQEWQNEPFGAKEEIKDKYEEGAC